MKLMHLFGNQKCDVTDNDDDTNDDADRDMIPMCLPCFAEDTKSRIFGTSFNISIKVRERKWNMTDTLLLHDNTF